MKRSSMVLITFITAAITFGTLWAVVGDKGMNYNHYGCHNQQGHNYHEPEKGGPVNQNTLPADNKL